MAKSFSPTQVKIGDVIEISETSWANQLPHAKFVVTGKEKYAVLLFTLSKIEGEKYHYSWDFRKQWTAKQLSAHYAVVYRGGKKVGSITTKYW